MAAEPSHDQCQQKARDLLRAYHYVGRGNDAPAWLRSFDRHSIVCEEHLKLSAVRALYEADITPAAMGKLRSRGVTLDDGALQQASQAYADHGTAISRALYHSMDAGIKLKYSLFDNPFNKNGAK